MRISHCLIHYLPEYLAGTEVYVHTLARLQSAAGHEVSVITPHIDFHRPGRINAHYEFESVNVYQYLEPSNPNDRRYYDGRKIPEGLKHFSDLLYQLNPEVVHFHQLNRGVGLSIEHVKTAKSFGAKVFVTMHLSFYSCNTNLLMYQNQMCDGIIRPMTCAACSLSKSYGISYSLSSATARLGNLAGFLGLTRLLGNTRMRTMLSFPEQIRRLRKDLYELSNQVNQIVCIAKWYKEILIKNGVPEQKITFIPQALPEISNQHIFQEKKQPIQLPLRLVFIGRIQWQKGVHLLIEACSKFSSDELSLDIYGKPEDSKYYRDCLKSSSGIGHIFWRGSIDRSEVLSMLSRYDLLCLPSSFSEMSPLVIQEAFKAGIPVLASRVYGNMEQINEGVNGLLFDFNSPNDLHAKLDALVKNSNLLDNLKLSEKPVDDFGEVFNKYMEVYEQC